MTDLSSIRLFATHPHDCSYLENRQATTLFVDPELKMDRSLYSKLSALGFRRSGEHLYRPRCQKCRACIATRVAAAHFKPNRSQRRCWKKNQDIEVRISEELNTALYYPLYERYIYQRHADGDMYPPSEEQFNSFLLSAWDVTRYVEFWLEDKLVGIAVMDQLESDLTAVYTFYDPDLPKRSLGVFAILWQIHHAAKENLNHVYLGYWIKECDKMNYKLSYRPAQLFIDNNWLTLN
ncbi:MAG: arginyltransferase [Candidatus Pelagadaptatus aseana]|uniref:arginyltransferase n=1 Tax=Candidatus Pelagadaptatus aseana TaxID=3120508 RepID=UPI0039B2A90E